MAKQGWKRSRALAVAGLALAASMLGCGDLKGGPEPTAKCVRTGDQCKLPDGPLGVCSEVECKPGQAAPCLVCMSQH